MLSFRRGIGHVAPKAVGRRLAGLRLAAARGARPGARVEAMEQRVLLAMPTLWTSHGPGGGGAFFYPVIAPNGQDIWVNSDMSGIYHSGDFGHSWQMKPFHAAIGGVNGGRNSQVVATSDPNVLYIANTGKGMVKSTDGGTTWSVVAGWANGTAWWMTADPANSSRILASNGTNLYLSTNGGTSFSAAYSSSNLYVAGVFWEGSNVYVGTNKGLLTSTTGGASFALTTMPNGQAILSFTGARQGTTTRLMAITTSGSPGPDTVPIDLPFGALYRLDVGGTWTSLSVPANNTMRNVAMARNNISIAYLGGTDWVSMTQVLKTTDGGTSWSDVFRTGFSGDGATPNNNIYSGYEGRLGDFDYWWGGIIGLTVAPNDPNTLFECDFGFLHTTTDGGATWHQAYTSSADENPPGQATPKNKAYHGIGIEDTVVESLEWLSPTNMFAGYADTDGFRSSDGGASWAMPIWNGLANNTVYSTQLASDGKLYAGSSNVHMMYLLNMTDARCNPMISTGQSFNQDGRVIVSTDQGATWSLIHDFAHPVVWVQLDPANPNRMYASVVDGPGSSTGGAYGGIWVTNNLNLGASSTWTKLANPPRTEGHPYNIRILNDGSLVVSYSCRRAGSPEAFTRSSGVFYSTDGGQTWQDRTLINVNNTYGAPDMSYYTRDVVIDPTDATQNTWYAGVFGGWGGKGNEAGDVYRTTDRGVHWTRMQLYRSTAYPRGNSISVQSITINPTTHEMYVTTDTSGLLYAPDATKPGLSYTDFSDLTSFPYWGPKRVYFSPYGKHDVWTTSGGSGIWEGGVGPDGLTATATSSTQVQVSWNDNSDNEAGFQIDRATDPGFTQNLVTTTAGQNATSTSIAGLNPLTQYYFRIRATNGANKSANSGSASATTLSANQAPTDIALSDSSIAENRPVGTVVGTLSTTDPNAGDTFSYTLVSGSGSTDNASFTISGNQLLTAASFNYEAKNSYSIRVRSTDQGGLYTEKVFTITVTDVDEIAPTVTAVYVRGSTWSSNYLSFLSANLAGSSATYGYAIPVGTGDTQLQTLPWRNLNQISIAFSEDVSVAQAQFAIVGSVGSYSVSGFSYNSSDHVATWSLSAAIGPDKLYVAVPGSGASPIVDLAGNILDGEWNNPASYVQLIGSDTFPSGDGVAGGDFAFRFDVLPGDSTGGSLGKVNVADVLQTKSRSNLPVTVSTYRSDFDGNNLVNVADVLYVKSKSSIYSLPVNPPTPPVFGPVFSQVSLLQAKRRLY